VEWEHASESIRIDVDAVFGHNGLQCARVVVATRYRFIQQGVSHPHTWTRSDTANFSSDRCSGPLATITGQGTWGRRAPSTCRDQPIDVLRDVPVTQSGGINQPADRRCDRKLVRFEAIRWENPNGGYFLSPVFGRHAAQPSRGARSSSK